MGLLKKYIPAEVTARLYSERRVSYTVAIPTTRCGALSFHESTGREDNTATIIIGELGGEFGMNVVLGRAATGITTHYDRPIEKTPFSVISIQDSEYSGTLKDRSSEVRGLLLPDEAEMVVWSVAKILAPEKI
jgi:hypothetical protein